MRPHIRGRRRCLDQAKKVELCDLVAHGASIEEAADTLNVSVRTVQREAKEDEDFHHELKVSLGCAPDPLRMMQTAARAHWRAAAWLLERSDPEHYAKRPASSASPKQFEAALTFVLEAALQATAPEQREAVYDRVQRACEKAFECVFPNVGPWGRPKNPQLPPTPLADQEQLKRFCDPPRHRQVFDNDPAIESRTANEPFDRPMQPRPLAGGRYVARESLHAGHATPGQRPGLKGLLGSAVLNSCDQRAVLGAQDPAHIESFAKPPSTAAQAGGVDAHPTDDELQSTAYGLQTNGSHRRLPWQFRLRAAQSAQSTLPRAATSASIFGSRILSPKTRFATKFDANRQATDQSPGTNGVYTPNGDPANERKNGEHFA